MDESFGLKLFRLIFQHKRFQIGTETPFDQSRLTETHLIITDTYFTYFVVVLWPIFCYDQSEMNMIRILLYIMNLPK